MRDEDGDGLVWTCSPGTSDPPPPPPPPPGGDNDMNKVEETEDGKTGKPDRRKGGKNKGK
ncbi:MAG: hypothetical protein ABUT39_15835 [Acidobacteriota bacterium]